MKFPYLILIPLLLISCSGNDDDTNDPNPIPEPQDDLVQVSEQQQVQALKAFSNSLFTSVTANRSKNTIVAPVSVYSALLLAMEGASNETKQEILKALEVSETEPVGTAETYLDLMLSITSDSPALCKSANAYFVDSQKLQLHESYKNTVENQYGAEGRELDFSDPGSVDIINDWAKDNTEGRITKVLEEISPEDAAFLMNALYFIGDWENGFPEFEGFEHEIEFTKEDGSSIVSPAMSHDHGRLGYKDDQVKIVDLPIKGGEYSVTIMNREDDEPLSSIFSRADFYDYHQDLITKTQAGRMLLTMPKFELKGNLKLKSVLQALGMQKAFSPGVADFSTMGQAAGNIYLTKVLHDTYLKVDERGIEGAAVTTVGVGVTSAPPAYFFDKPFVIILRHVETNIPLFMATVMNPLEQ